MNQPPGRVRFDAKIVK